MVKVGCIYRTNNSGLCEVIEVNSSRSVKVKFVDTGFVVSTTSGAVERGQVKDKLLASVSGVGYIGDGEYRTHENGVKTAAYSVWKSMIERCYSDNLRRLYPTYHNCKVCDEWHNFQNFAKWYSENYPNDGGSYELDKDLSDYGGSGKLYSPETCLFVTRQVNSEESHAKSYRVLNPTGEVIDIYNMSKFCRENNLNIGAMCAVGRGKLKSHKGYAAIVDKTNYRKQ